MEVMRVREDTRLLDGRVELDDAYLGAPRRIRRRSSPRCKPRQRASLSSCACASSRSRTRRWRSSLHARSRRRPSWSPTGCAASVRCSWSVPITRATSPAAARPAPSWRSSRRSTPSWATSSAAPGRHASRLRLCHVRPSLPRRGPIPIQPSIRSALHLVSLAARRLPLNPSPGALHPCG
jgi:hypothetical protein